jgi:hypothetical protein
MDEKDIITTHRSAMANEANWSSGIELGHRLIPPLWLGTEAAILHFKKKNLVNIPEVLDLYNISSVSLRQKNRDTHKCVVPNVARQDCRTDIKCAVTNLVRETWCGRGQWHTLEWQPGVHQRMKNEVQDCRWCAYQNAKVHSIRVCGHIGPCL